jgi:hypothetical protein
MHIIQVTLRNIPHFLQVLPIAKMKFIKVVWIIAPKNRKSNLTVNKPRIYMDYISQNKQSKSIQANINFI